MKKPGNCTMRIKFFKIFAFFITSGLSLSAEEPPNLWPPVEPFKTDYLQVSPVHNLYYEQCGNPNGKPVFVLHGGPGGGSSPYMRRFFNPKVFHIVLHDQRGSGKSVPYADIRENTTAELVEDIEVLRKHLNLGPIILFGGSWGATLALAYSETYPENVSGMVIRGVFLGTWEEINHFYHGGVSLFFPEVYEKLLAAVPDSIKRPLPNILYQNMRKADSRGKYNLCKAWVKYEARISELNISDAEVEGFLKDYDPTAFGLLENYYMANHCFLEENQLLNHADKLLHIPTIIINGRYDMVCPPVAAYKLHKKLPQSKLVIIEGAGHWMGDKPIETALLKAMREFE